MLRLAAAGLALLLMGAAADPAPPEPPTILLRVEKQRRARFSPGIRLTRRAGDQQESAGVMGHLGDTLELEPGQYEISVDRAGFSLTASLEVSAAAVNVIGTTWSTGCGSMITTRITSWTPAIVAEGEVFVLRLPAPVVEPLFGSSQISCSLSPWTVTKTIRLTLQSTPPGSDVLLHDEKIGSTDAELAVPVRQRENALYVGMHRKGFATCIRRIDASVDAATVTCRLRPLPPRP